MAYWIGFLGLFIGLFSPAAGVMFFIPAVGYYVMENKQFKNRFFACWYIFGVLLFLINIIDKVQASNLVLGAGFSCLFLFNMIKKEYGLNQIFMSLLFYNTGFIALRQILYSEYIFAQYNESVEAVMNVLSNRFQEGSEQYLVFIEMIDMSTNFYLRYSPGVWIATMMLCLMIGYYLLSRKYPNFESLRFIQTHLIIIYSLIIALIVAIFLDDYRVYAINYLIAIVPLFLMQGLAVLKFKIGKWFENSKLLLIIAIISLLINPYIVLFITVIGLFDNWFDFRSLSKPEDLNESHTDGNA